MQVWSLWTESADSMPSLSHLCLLPFCVLDLINLCGSVIQPVRNAAVEPSNLNHRVACCDELVGTPSLQSALVSPSSLCLSASIWILLCRCSSTSSRWEVVSPGRLSSIYPCKSHRARREHVPRNSSSSISGCDWNDKVLAHDV